LRTSRDIFVGIDVGTSTVNTVITKTDFSGASSKTQVIGVGVSPSFGLRKGVVVDIEDVVGSIRKSVEEAERVSGIKIDHAYISVGGNHIKSVFSKGVVAVSRADGEISNEDVERVIAASEAISLPLNREVLHVIPRVFTVDSETGIRNPVGMNGVRLEVDTLIIDGSTPFIKNLIKCVNEAGINIDALVLDILASSRAVLNKRQKDLGVICLDVGGGTSSLCVYEEGDLIHIQVLPVGALHITNDLAIGLRTAIDIAERVKIEYGSCMPDEIHKNDTIDLTKFGFEDEGLVSRKEVSSIIEARVLEILNLATKELKKIDRERLLPAGVVILGGGAKIPGFVDVAKQELRLPAQLGFPIEFDGIVDRIDDPSFATALGLVLWGIDMELSGKKQGISLNNIPSIGNTVNKMKKWFKAFMP
jgi:cell division protein FtsA